MTTHDLGPAIAVVVGALLLTYGAAPLIRGEMSRFPLQVKSVSKKGIGVGAVLISGVLSGIYLEGSFLHLLLVMGGYLFLLPALLLVGVLLGWRTFTPIWCAVAAMLLVSWIVGSSIHNGQIASIRSYVEKTVPLLDELKSREGRYPAALPAAESGRAPKLLTYQSDGTTFRFEYWDRAGMMDGYAYTSEVRSWEYFD